MKAHKPSRRKVSAKKLEPIDWHEFANDAVLNGNMSTLYRRPATEDVSGYASPEALAEIERRIGRPAIGPLLQESVSSEASEIDKPAVGAEPIVGPELTPALAAVAAASVVPIVGAELTVGLQPAVGLESAQEVSFELQGAEAVQDVKLAQNTVGTAPTVGIGSPEARRSEVDKPRPTVVSNVTLGPSDVLAPHVGIAPTVGRKPTAGVDLRRSKPIRDVQDALTLAGQVLYRAMYGSPDGSLSKTCSKGYRQLAAETHLDKDTIRDLIRELKQKGIVRQTGMYDPDTRSAKTYEVLPHEAILQLWRDAGIGYVTAGRQRPRFCTAQGELVTLEPAVGNKPTVGC